MVSDGFIHACAGGAGGMIAMTATYPLVSISMRAAVEQSRAKDKTMVEAAQKVIREEGVVGLYSGLSSSLLGISITNFVYYGFFETAREMILASKNKGAAKEATTAAATIAAGGALSTAESMLAGALAGSATTVITNPIWVVNTRQTVRVGVDSGSGSKGKPGAPVRKMGFLETIRYIISTDGVPALWRGLGPALFLVINPILQYTAFEQLKNMLVTSRLTRGVSASLSDLDFFFLGALS
ncbi:mitochondrial carrier, partial [Microstroma glucosiphilum]